MSILDAVAPVKLPPEGELAKYDGLWVVVFDGKIVGFGKSPATALTRASAKGVEEPDLVFRAPLRPEGRAYY
jgi:Family of unknown function (DUF5678)